LWLFAADGKPRGEIPLPSLGTVAGLGADRDGDDLFYGFTSFLTPTAVYRHVGGDADDAPGIVWRRLASPIDPAAFEVERTPFTSRDGTRCLMFLVHKKGTPRDGARPTLLTGYGGFNISMQPGWAPSAAPFLERGGVYALAILRGGGEFGEAWHQAGMLGHKQNVFDDFIAAAEWLIANKVTSRDHLAISGRSNGGLLMGAALTQRPDLFRAVVCGVPLLDMLRYDRFRIGQLWIPEYGAADDPQAFKWLYAYSPYHHVKDGVAYPAVLLHTAVSDTRVDPMHARKMTARLQAATAGARPILLRVESKAGHGAGKPLGKTIDQLIDEWSFLFAELGIDAGHGKDEGARK
jgi:prolyl oligopeptidase